MTRLLRRACVAALVLVFLGATSASGALVINPPNQTTLTSRDGRYIINRLDGTQVFLTCNAITKIENINAAGFNTIPLNNIMFAGCLLNGLGANVVQTQQWSGPWIALLLNGQITGLLKRLTIAMRVNVPLAGCVFDVRGTKSALGTVRPTTPPALFSLASVTYTNGPLDVLGMIVFNVMGAGCGALGIVNGLSVGYTGTLTLTPVMTGTLI